MTSSTPSPEARSRHRVVVVPGLVVRGVPAPSLSGRDDRVEQRGAQPTRRGGRAALAARHRADPGEAERYAVVRPLLFQHGVRSDGIATPDDWAAVVRAAGAEPDFLGLDLRRFPPGIGFFGRHGDRLDALPRTRHLWESLRLPTALDGLGAAGLVRAGGTT